jgi:hypothetical protein
MPLLGRARHSCANLTDNSVLDEDKGEVIDQPAQVGRFDPVIEAGGYSWTLVSGIAFCPVSCFPCVCSILDAKSRLLAFVLMGLAFRQ